MKNLMSRFRLALVGLAAACLALGVAVVDRGPDVVEATPVGYTAYFVNPTPQRIYDNVINGGGIAYVNVATNVHNDPSCWEAAHVNITMDNPAAPNFFTAYANTARPNTSVLNGVPGQAIANAVTVPTYAVGTTIRFRIYTYRKSRIVVDVHGVYLGC